MRLSRSKPIGGVEGVALYPADAVTSALFSSEGCEVELSGVAVEVPLLDDSSYYTETSKTTNGVTRISHLLHLVADRNDATEWLTEEFIERAYFEGFVAVISLCSGRQLLAGYSALFENEQPLRLESLTHSSGSGPHEVPSVTLRLIAHDTAFSPNIL
jgi:hypothetical protein